MDNEHVHHMRYTLHMQPTHWWRRLWGGSVTMVMQGVKSSQQGNELLIFGSDGSFCSINYNRVHFMQVEAID